MENTQQIPNTDSPKESHTPADSVTSGDDSQTEDSQEQEQEVNPEFNPPVIPGKPRHPSYSGTRHAWRRRLFAAWVVLLDNDTAEAYRMCYVSQCDRDPEHFGPRLILQQDIADYALKIRSAMRLRPISGLSQAEMDTAVLEAAYRLTQDTSMSPRERASAIKEYATLRKGLSMQGAEVPALAAAGSLSDFLDAL